MPAPRRVVVAVSLVVVVALRSAGVPEAASVPYALIIDEVRDLGVYLGQVSSEAHAINENGAIAGSGQSSTGSRRALFWATPTSWAAVSLGHLGGGWSEAWGINDAGVVVGNSRLTSSEQSRAFRWTQASGMSDLGLVGMTIGGLDPVTYSTASDINNNNVIVGVIGDAYVGGGYFYGWGVSLVPRCQDGLTDKQIFSSAAAINDNNFFTGQVTCSGGPLFAPYFASLSSSVFLPTHYSSDDSGHAINSHNVVAGTTSLSAPKRHAFRWSAAGSFKDIHPTDDTDNSAARGINDHGLIVGRKCNDTSTRAFVYSGGIGMKTLPGLCSWGSWTSVSEAYAVNNSGWVVGTSKTCAGQYHAALWKVRVVPVINSTTAQ